DGVLVADFEDSDYGTNVPIAGSTSVEEGKWYHVAVTFDGTAWAIYLDGNLEATADAGGLVPRADSIQPAAVASALNSSNEPAGFFHGLMDEIRIWDRALSEEELRARTNFEVIAESNLVARWDFSEGTGSVVTSTASGELTGTLMGSSNWVTGSTFTNNVKPSVSLTSPHEGDRYLVGDSIYLSAAAEDPDGSIAEVSFYDNGILIGTDTTEPFEYTYSSAPLGGLHELMAIAKDNQGETTRSSSLTVDVTVGGPTLPGYSVGVVNGGDVDADTDPPVEPAPWAFELTTSPPFAFEGPGTVSGEVGINIDGSPVAFDSGVLLATNYSVLGNIAAADNNLAAFDASGNVFLSMEDNGNPGESDPDTPKESSGASLGFFPYSDGWMGGYFSYNESVISPISSNLPTGVTVEYAQSGLATISGLPTTGNLLVMSVGEGSEIVPSVGQSGADWSVITRDNSSSLESADFGFLYIPETAQQVFSGLVQSDGTLEALNDDLSFVGATVNLGTQGYEVTIGDGSIINPSNSVMFISPDYQNGNAGDNIMSYSSAGNTFVVFSQDLPGLNSQFQSGGFRFVIAPIEPATLNGDEVVILASDDEALENSEDDLVFTFTRSGSTESAIEVTYTVSGTATPGEDFMSLPGSVVIPAGESSASVVVSAEGDIELELAETVVLTITAGDGYSVGTFNAATGEILNAEPLIPTTTLSFQEGVDGYTGQYGKRVGENGVNELGSAVDEYFLDGTPGNADSHDINGIVRFDHIIGSGPGQIPEGAEVINARLYMTTSTVSDAQSGGPYIVDRLIYGVDDSTTWSDLGFDDSTDYEGFEGVRGSSSGLPVAGFAAQEQGQVGEADVTKLVQHWAAGNPNHGFAIYTGGTTNGWSYNTVGNPNPVLRPRLEVTYTMLEVKEYFYEADLSAIIN
ncbi:MAG: LamG-like jellyroll fold domain-containing protein, partial [Verrucomicrobiales bacterium]